MKRHRVVICGITRDNSKELPFVMKYIEHTGEHFQDYRVIVVENDSTDGTKDLLQEWSQRNHKVRVISQDYHNKKRPNIEFMAQCRNKYLELLEKDHEYDDFDLLMVVDLDLLYGWSMKGIYHSFYYMDEWTGICSNGIKQNGMMYDTFAYRKEKLNRIPKDWKEIWSVDMKFAHTDKLQPVFSCFGGVAFYKRFYVNKCRYSSPYGDCEHVPFHECMKNNYGIMLLNPTQIVHYEEPL